MSRRLIVLMSMVLVVLLLTVGAAFAQGEPTKQVGVVVAFPDGTSHTEIVSVPANATTLDALRAADITLVTQPGSFGESICTIEKTGCPADNCFCDPQKFWAYYHLNGSAWAASAEGVGAVVPADKSVEGFVWSGFDAAFNPTEQPAVFTFDQLSAQGAMTGLPILPILLGLIAVLLVVLLVYRRRQRAA